ncbi:hypothetical protein DICSQDRAFT_156724 [Dichomitus squalens LYAD-421 SS1]|uniref:Uncharacterized protein n=1 Tax=Dichomitus squalens (strain LYAD-421) TaxID=732165 RepID=R7SRZ8_DICSQ|nr:uncharacterized protein DICSQDRAFT_156724 [Dichomitus squalens LYAD-421 SS1]EJF58530.1 hypothetical protein DICSQDRAFT_156724 [Dichomitus squalens LYAD-421 SS1]
MIPRAGYIVLVLELQDLCSTCSSTLVVLRLQKYSRSASRKGEALEAVQATVGLSQVPSSTPFGICLQSSARTGQASMMPE